MATSSLSLTLISKPLTEKSGVRNWEFAAVSTHRNAVGKCSMNASTAEEKTQCTAAGICRRGAITLGIGALAVNLIPSSPLLAEGVPQNYSIFVDKIDGYSYYYPSDWREFEFTGHDSAFKDRLMQLQNVRLSFIPTSKTDIQDLGPMPEVVEHLVTNVYSAPTQVADVLDMQERNIDGRNYYTFEYILTSPNFARAAFASIAIGNGRYYTLIVGANERRWKRYRNQLKVVANSFRVLDI